MTNEELLVPRYLVIADYPANCSHKVGSIFSDNGKSMVTDQNGRPLFICDWDKFPHIFKPIAWYEKREEKDMPEYVKNAADGIVFKVVARFKKTPSSIQVKAKGAKNATWHALCDLLPATKEEFDNQKLL